MEEAQNMLEEVFRVAPVPEDYMKYQLHLSTGMEVPQIEQWFQTRRSNEGGTQRPMEGNADWSSMQRPTIQITSGAERLPSNSGQRRPGRPDLAQPPKALQAGARSNSGDGLQARRSSQQGALLAAEHPGRIPEHSPRSRDATANSDRLQPFPFPELHSDPDPGSSRGEALQEGQLAGLPTLDWLSENPTSDARGRPGSLASAGRQPSGALMDASIGDPAELLSQPNAPFLLSFLNSRENDSRHVSRKDSAPGTSDNGGFKAPAAPGEQQGLRHQRSSGSDQLQLRSADRPPTTPGGMRQSQSPRQALHHHQQHHFQQQHPQQQQLQRMESLNGRPWRAHANSSAPMLDCTDVLPPESSEPEWHGQMLTTLGGSMPVSATRQWRQNWGHLGSQGYGEQEMMYSVSMTSSMESSRDAFSMRHSEASQQMEELERGQILERGTVSLPSMQNFRQELLKAPNYNSSGAGDLATWRRPGNTTSGEAPAFIPSPNRVSSQEPRAPPPVSSLDNRSSDPIPVPKAAETGDAPAAARRPAALPRSISDISETHSLQGYASLRDHGSATDANLVAEDTPTAEPEPDAVSEARFVEEDLECVKGLIGLQTITSLQEYDGSKQLFLFEQLTHLDSLDIDTSETHPSKRRRVRHQHFWRNSDKLPPDHRLYVASADIKQALEESEPVRGRRQITSAERTNMWSVCLTSKGVLNYLNRRISPVGVRLFRASLRQAKGGSAGQALSEKVSLPPMLAPRPKPMPSPAAAAAAAAVDEHKPDEDTPAAGTRKRRSRLRRESPA